MILNMVIMQEFKADLKIDDYFERGYWQDLKADSELMMLLNIMDIGETLMQASSRFGIRLSPQLGRPSQARLRRRKGINYIIIIIFLNIL